MPATGLGLDAGGSATRWALCDATGAPLAAGELPPVSGHLADPAARTRLHDAATALRAALAGLAHPTAAIAGITGLSAGSPEAATATAALATALDLPPAAIHVREDSWIAYHAAFAPGAGHLVYAGTGSIGLHIRADGTTLRVGGHGWLIDDGGSAFWIGRQALRATLRAADATPGHATPLSRALATAIGGSDWDTVRAHVYGPDGRHRTALLARTVAATDDPQAHAILRRAGTELARLARALAGREGAKPVALAGRAAGLHPLILDAMRAAAPELAIERRAIDPALAAARLAAGEGA